MRSTAKLGFDTWSQIERPLGQGWQDLRDKKFVGHAGLDVCMYVFVPPSICLMCYQVCARY